MTVPGFDIRDAGGVQSNWRGKGRNRLFGVRDARGGTVQCEEVSGRGDGAAGDSGAMFIGYPARVITKVTGVGVVAIEGEDGDETDSGSRDVEDVLKMEFVTRRYGEVN